MTSKRGLIVLATIGILFIIGWFVFRAMREPDSEIVIESGAPKVHSINTMTPGSLKLLEKKAVENGAIVGKKALKNSDDESFQSYDRLEKGWLEKANTIIGAKDYPMYQEMRARADKEKMQAYKEYHDYLRQKYGDKFEYNISDDQSIREKKINQRYLGELAKLIGTEKFIQYTKARDLYNEALRRKIKEPIQIEF